MEIHYKLVGGLLIALALFHGIFPSYFKWKTELRSLSLVNRQIMTVHTFFIALTLFLMGILCLIRTTALLETELGNTISLGLGIFWSVRLLIQFLWYSPDLWKGKALETSMHVLFSLLWAYFSFVFFYSFFA